MTPTNVPARLLAAIRRAGSERKFAKLQNVNILYVSQLLRDGIEPTDRTEKGQAARVKLFLPKKKPKPGRVRTWLPGEWKTARKIGKLAKQTEKDVMRSK